jgi:hypothetical protein
MAEVGAHKDVHGNESRLAPAWRTSCVVAPTQRVSLPLVVNEAMKGRVHVSACKRMRLSVNISGEALALGLSAQMSTGGLVSSDSPSVSHPTSCSGRHQLSSLNRHGLRPEARGLNQQRLEPGGILINAVNATVIKGWRCGRAGLAPAETHARKTGNPATHARARSTAIKSERRKNSHTRRPMIKRR